jgi:hypothetical protein
LALDPGFFVLAVGFFRCFAFGDRPRFETALGFVLLVAPRSFVAFGFFVADRFVLRVLVRFFITPFLLTSRLAAAACQVSTRLRSAVCFGVQPGCSSRKIAGLPVLG